MIDILKSKLAYLKDMSETASNWEYYLGQYNLCEELLYYNSHPKGDWECNEGTLHSYEDACYCSYERAEFEDNNPYYYFSDIDKYMLERRDLIEEQVENAHNILYFTRGIGKSVINLDSYWFTSDEIEAFRLIWQRRISAI